MLQSHVLGFSVSLGVELTFHLWLLIFLWLLEWGAKIMTSKYKCEACERMILTVANISFKRFRYPFSQWWWMDYAKIKVVLICTIMKKQIPQKGKLSLETDLISLCSESSCWSSLSFRFWGLEDDFYLSQLFLILFHSRSQNNNKHITLLPVYIKSISWHQVFQSFSWYWCSSWVTLKKVVLTFCFLGLLTLWAFLLNLHAILPWHWNKMEETHFKNWLCSG